MFCIMIAFFFPLRFKGPGVGLVSMVSCCQPNLCDSVEGSQGGEGGHVQGGIEERSSTH